MRMTKNVMTKGRGFMTKSRASRNMSLRASHKRTRSTTSAMTSAAASRGRGVFKGPMNFKG